MYFHLPPKSAFYELLGNSLNSFGNKNFEARVLHAAHSRCGPWDPQQGIVEGSHQNMCQVCL